MHKQDAYGAGMYYMVMDFSLYQTTIVIIK